jgi:hypothetical protein
MVHAFIWHPPFPTIVINFYSSKYSIEGSLEGTNAKPFLKNVRTAAINTSNSETKPGAH